jgi:hypothetical protein
LPGGGTGGSSTGGYSMAASSSGTYGYSGAAGTSSSIAGVQGGPGYVTISACNP